MSVHMFFGRIKDTIIAWGMFDRLGMPQHSVDKSADTACADCAGVAKAAASPVAGPGQA